MGSGHYKSTCYNSHLKKWYEFNDSKFSEVEEQNVVTNFAYVLFYQRQDVAQTTPDFK